ncbi:MAG: DNA polymerase III subunit gamma/tau [Anaerolineae bacterium]
MPKALYLKYRPQTFEQVEGQEHITRTLINALAIGRIGHAYLFTGPRGTGKTSTARILAKAVNCLATTGTRPCNACAMCRAINEERLLDLIEIDAASNTGVDDIRDLREKVDFRPTQAKRKFYIIDECFRYEDLITLADGSKMPIGKIVENELCPEVLSYNERTHQIEPKRVVRRMRKQPTLPAVRLAFDNNRALVCTLNHKFYTPQGQMRAGELEVGQFVYAGYERTTTDQLDAVAGAAIGDGHLDLTGSQMRARLSITQGVDQKEYLEYKTRLLGDLVETPPQYQLSLQSFSKKGTWHVATVSRPQIAELHRELYDHEGHKRISRTYLDRLTPLGLALWYLDDGSLITQKNPYTRKDGTVTSYPNSRSTLATYSSSLEEAHIILQWLEEKWDIEGGIAATAKGPVIWLTLAGTEQLHEIIAPYVPPSMAYKLLPRYHNRFCPPTDAGIPSGLAVSVVRRIERVTPPEYVYNIEVANNHNYFARDILVANCHMLSNAAFNALLKTLEEPPPHVIFVLATTEPNKIPATITSRCQRFDFHRATLQELIERLTYIAGQEELNIEPAALELIARQATGSFRDAASLLDQLMAFGGTGDGAAVTLAQVEGLLGAASQETIHAIVAAIAARDIANGMSLIGEAVDAGADPRQLARELVDYVRGVLLFQVGSGASLTLGAETQTDMTALASEMSADQILRAIRLFNQAAFELRGSASPTLPLEMALVETVLEPTAAVAVAPAPRAPAPPRPNAVLPSAIPVSPAPAPAIAEPPRDKPQPASASEPVAVKQRTPARPELEPEPAPESAPGAGTVELTLEQVQQQWPTVLLRLRKLNKTVEALLRDAQPISLKGDIITIGFFYELHKTKVESNKNGLAQIDKIMAELFGKPYHCKCIVSPKKQKMRAAENDPVIRAALDLGGRIRDVTDES